MKYRVLGRTGLRVSEVGLGGHEYRRRDFVRDGRFTELDPCRRALIRALLDRGVSYFDTTFTEEAQSLGAALKALGVPRSDVVISGMSIQMLGRLQEREPSQWEAFVRDEVAERLELLHTDYLDVFLICALDSSFTPTALDGAMEILQRLKCEGAIRHIGASAHRPEALAQVIRERDPFDVVMVPLNFRCAACEDLLSAVRDHQVGLVAMKPFVWFDYGVPFPVLCRQAIGDSAAEGPTPAQMALRWILSLPEVSTLVPAANCLAEAIENAEASHLPLDAVDLELLKACRDLPKHLEGMVALIDHPYAEVRHYALAAVRQAAGADYGTDKERYLAALRARAGG